MRKRFANIQENGVAILVIRCVSSPYNISAANATLSAQTSSDGSSAVYDNTLDGYWFRDLGSFPWAYGNGTDNITILDAGNS